MRDISRLPSLTGMRFIAALLVFALHVVVYLFGQFNQAPKDIGWQLGAVGVSFFFVLSGFILTWSAPAGDTVRAFWRRRAFKIYPTHLVTFLAALLILALLVGQAVGGWSWLPNLLLVQTFFPGRDVAFGFNAVAWTLSCEAVFYFSFPLLVRAINRVRRERLWPAAATVVAAIFAMPFVASVTGPQPKQVLLDGLTTWDFYLIYQFPLVRMLEFVFGIFLARLVMTGRQRWPGLGPSTALVLAAFALSLVGPPAYALVAIKVVPLGMLIVAAATSDIRKRTTPLSVRPMVWLGEISFAFYMWHSLVLLCAFHLFLMGKVFSAPVTLAIAAALLGISVIVSWVQFALVERPIMRRFARPRRSRPAPVVSLVLGTTPDGSASARRAAS